MSTITKGLFTSLAALLTVTACGSEGTGTGGTAGAGGTTAGAGGGGGSTATGSIVLDGGFYESGTYKGYLFTAVGTGSTITPPCGTAGPCFVADACVTGTVPKVSSATAYSAEWGAMVGWNINQEKIPPNPEGTATLDGKTINVTLAPGAKPLPAGMRVKVAVGGVDYCTPLVGNTASVAVANLKKECWTPGGAGVPAGALISQIAVQVVSDANADKPFDFCISALSIQ